VIGRLSLLARVGRSSAYDAARHGVMRGPAYEDALARARALPSTPQAAARRGRLLRLLGRREEAQLALAAAARLAPRLPEAHAWLWEASSASLRPRAAAEGLDRAVALAPKAALWRAWRGLARLSPEGRTDRAAARAALADFDAAAALDPRLTLAHAGRALALGALGEGRRAARALDAAARLSPEEGWLYQLRARARLSCGDREGFLADTELSILRDEALGDFAKILGSMPGYAPDRLARAAGEFLAREPRAWWMLAFRGDCRRSPEVRDFRGSLEDLEKAVELRPRCGWAWAYLARAREALGDQAGGLAAAAKAAALAPGSGWIRVWRGELLRKAGETRAALTHLSRGLSLNPDYELGYAWRGAARLELGEAEGALADLELACRLSPDYPFAARARTQALRALGRAA
jgi:tetratricopeptide (TPR) repeat protein